MQRETNGASASAVCLWGLVSSKPSRWTPPILASHILVHAVTGPFSRHMPRRKLSLAHFFGLQLGGTFPPVQEIRWPLSFSRGYRIWLTEKPSRICLFETVKGEKRTLKAVHFLQDIKFPPGTLLLVCCCRVSYGSISTAIPTMKRFRLTMYLIMQVFDHLDLVHLFPSRPAESFFPPSSYCAIFLVSWSTFTATSSPALTTGQNLCKCHSRWLNRPSPMASPM